MKFLLYFLVAYGSFLLIYFTRKFLKKRKENKKSLAALQPKIKTFKQAVSEFEGYLNLNGSYFSNYILESWNLRYVELSGFILLKCPNYDKIGLKESNISLIKEFQNFQTNGEFIRSKFNEQFVAREKEKYSQFFSDIEGNSLDNQQRHCVITDEDNNLVIAGAGSGKTTTIVGKVSYLLDRYKINPNRIILISFTTASAKDLVKRVGIPGIEAKTFHALGLNIIRNVEGRKISIYNNKMLKRDIGKIFNGYLQKSSYLKEAIRYFTYYLNIDKSEFDFENMEDYIQYIKEQNFRTYRKKEGISENETFNREVVRSREEWHIANFLLFHNVRYEYEHPYELDTSSSDYQQYKPDFTIYFGDQKIYLEHFGIQRNGDVPPFFANEKQTYEQARDKYNRDIEWKRNLHQENETILIESYSYEKSEGTLLKNLAEKLKNAGVPLHPMTEKEKWNIINGVASTEINNTVDLIIQFLALYKSNNVSKSEIDEKLKQQFGYLKERSKQFLRLFYPVYQAYQKMLEGRKELDFNDMINKAIGFVNDGKYIKTYDYIIVDEFQDSSKTPYELLRAFKQVNPKCKLFCVGDDWQSIYRFAGSDINLFNSFKSFFGATSISKIETTYRFKNPMIRISGDFICQNPSQIKKELKSFSSSEKTELKIAYSKSEGSDDTTAFLQGFGEYIFDRLKAKTANQYSFKTIQKMIQNGEMDGYLKELQKKKFLILARNNRDFNRLNKDNEKITVISKKSKEDTNKIQLGIGKEVFELEFLTMHKSKGLQANVVFILNCNAGLYGFPSEVSDDPVKELLLSASDSYPHSEERRLFYVALTRAKERTVCIANENRVSKFINEIDTDNKRTVKRCPRCKVGVLQVRENREKTRTFYGCTNFRHGCKYTKSIKK